MESLGHARQVIGRQSSYKGAPIKEFAYLVQGRANLVSGYEHLQKKNSDLYTLTYDERYRGGYRSIFDSNASWAAGRNRLLQEAVMHKYEYFVFLDDDAQISEGSFEQFEDLLLTHRPYVGLPLLDIIENSHRYCPKLSIQEPVALDQVVQAYSSQAVHDQKVLPFVTEFDSQSWWYSCEINSYLMLENFKGSVAQFNTVKFQNTNHAWSDNSLPAGSSYVGGISKEGLAEVWAWLISKGLAEGCAANFGFLRQRAIAEVQKTCRAHFPRIIVEVKLAYSQKNLIDFLKVLYGLSVTLTRGAWFGIRYRDSRRKVCRPFRGVVAKYAVN